MALELDPAIARALESEAALSSRELGIDLEAGLAKARLLANVLGESGSVGVTLGRFEVLRCIGRGGMGKVFEARDRQTGARLALKTLYAPEGDALARIKREFRALTDLSHPNLVAMYELHLVRGLPFFTMELVDGPALSEHLREGGAVDAEFIRGCLSQLRDALGAIHACGTVHGDIKPSNLLLRRDGTLILVDFGLARTLHEARPVPDSGTSAYMAPERMHAGSVGPPSDWYAVGAVLRGLLARVAPGALDPYLERLAALSAGLLEPDPNLRFGASEVEAALGASTAPRSFFARAPEGALRPPWHSASDLLLGRDAELAQLQSAFDALARGPGICSVCADPGLGKTALVEHFLASTALAQAVVLRGRCFEHEALPYKGFDAVVEALAAHLRSLPAEARAALVPKDGSDLLQVFPVLRGASYSEPALSQGERDPRALRRQAFSELSCLLGALAQQRRLVLFIDDLQWGDADGAALLEHLLLGPEQPGLLLIASYRSGESGPCVAVLEAARRACAHAALTLEPLTHAASTELARRLSQESLAEDAQASLAHESGGSPLLLRALLCSDAHAAGATPRTRSFDELVAHMLERLGPEASELLELTVLAGRPVGPELLRVAAQKLEHPWKPIAALRNARLLRTLARDGQLALLPHHDRVAEAVSGALGPAERRARHAALAEAAQSLGLDDPEFSADQHFRAGALVEAALHAERAGDMARAAVALQRACELYARALECLGPERPLRIVRKLAEACGAVGDMARAAPLYLEAAAGHGQDGWQLRLSAAEMVLLSGAEAAGMKLLLPALREAGIWLPASAPGVLALGLVSLARSYLARRPGVARDAARDRRAEIAFRIGYSITLMNPRHGAALLLWSGARALRHGSQAQRGRALGYLAHVYALIGLGSPGAQDAMIGEGLTLTERDCEMHAVVLCCDALVSFTRFECSQALRKIETAQAFILAERVEERWLLAQLQTIAASVRVMSGDFVRLEAFAAMLEREAAALGNRAVVAQAESARAWSALVLGDTAAMRQYALAAKREWRAERLSTLYGLAVWGECHGLLYQGDSQAALALMREEAPRFARSGVARAQSWSVALLQLWACVELSCSVRASDAHWRAAEALVRRLDCESPRWAAACAALIRGGLARRRHDPAEALRQYARARSGFERVGMHGYAAAAAYREAELRFASTFCSRAEPRASTFCSRAEPRASTPAQAAVPWFGLQSVAEPASWVRMVRAVATRSERVAQARASLELATLDRTLRHVEDLRQLLRGHALPVAQLQEYLCVDRKFLQHIAQALQHVLTRECSARCRAQCTHRRRSEVQLGVASPLAVVVVEASAGDAKQERAE